VCVRVCVHACACMWVWVEVGGKCVHVLVRVCARASMYVCL
jgi:hypothetical protein